MLNCYARHSEGCNVEQNYYITMFKKKLPRRDAEFFAESNFLCASASPRLYLNAEACTEVQVSDTRNDEKSTVADKKNYKNYVGES